MPVNTNPQKFFASTSNPASETTTVRRMNMQASFSLSLSAVASRGSSSARQRVRLKQASLSSTVTTRLETNFWHTYQFASPVPEGRTVLVDSARQAAPSALSMLRLTRRMRSLSIRITLDPGRVLPCLNLALHSKTKLMTGTVMCGAPNLDPNVSEHVRSPPEPARLAIDDTHHMPTSSLEVH